MTKKNKKYLEYISLAVAGLFFLFLSFVVISYIIIFREVRNTCIKAETVYQMNCVDSLVMLLQDNKPGIKEKNDAIWALGQIADPRALPVLNSLYTGDIPEREPLDKVISQYELKKAIHWIEKGNWTSWMYVHFKNNSGKSSDVSKDPAAGDTVIEIKVNSDEYMIKEALVKKHNWDEGDIKVTVEENDGLYAKGMVGSVTPGPGGGLWFAKKVTGDWEIVWDGNGIITCDSLKKYPDFPASLIPQCFDSGKDVMVTR